MEIPAPYAAARDTVRAEWIDYNGHMNVGYYHVVFDIATDRFSEFLGLTPEFRERHGLTTFALEAHLNFLREVKSDDCLRFTSRLLDFDAKRIHCYHEMFHVAGDYLAASMETLSSVVSMATRRTAAMPEELLDRMAAVKAAHAALPRPWQMGLVISARPLRRTDHRDSGSG
jgi:acyl-CoA thioester hydrolase